MDPFAEMGLSATAAEEKMKIHAKEKKKAPQMDWIKKYELFSNFWGGRSQGHGPERARSSWTGFTQEKQQMFLFCIWKQRMEDLDTQSCFRLFKAEAIRPITGDKYILTHLPLLITFSTLLFITRDIISHRSGRMLLFI